MVVERAGLPVEAAAAVLQGGGVEWVDVELVLGAESVSAGGGEQHSRAALRVLLILEEGSEILAYDEQEWEP
jgi:hypothetical protein